MPDNYVVPPPGEKFAREVAVVGNINLDQSLSMEHVSGMLTNALMDSLAKQFLAPSKDKIIDIVSGFLQAQKDEGIISDYRFTNPPYLVKGYKLLPGRNPKVEGIGYDAWGHLHKHEVMKKFRSNRTAHVFAKKHVVGIFCTPISVRPPMPINHFTLSLTV